MQVVDEYLNESETYKTRYCTFKDGPSCGPLSNQHLSSESIFDAKPPELKETYERALDRYQTKLRVDIKNMRQFDKGRA